MEETQTASWQDDGGGTATATAATARILVAYATRHGSTAEVAEAVGAELRDADVDVTVAQIGGGLRAEGYDAVVVGGPMIMGWHRDAARFLTKNAAALADRPTACFATAASLTQTPGEPVGGVPLFRDPWLVKAPRRADHLTFKERYTSPQHYLGGIVGPHRGVRFVGVAFFGGSVDLTKMNLLEKLFVMLIVAAAPGDLRNWDAVKEWSREIRPRLMGE